ncbi:MAG TPA: Flp pilus assembly protein CpaB [Anaerolineae bacterium]
MRPRTFILLILVLLVAALAVILIVATQGGGGPIADVLPLGNGEEEETPAPVEEPGLPPPTETPSIRLVPVVVARVDLPVGERLTSELLEVEMRPNTNVALQGGYTFSDPEEIIGRIVKVRIDEGQAILDPMLAANPTDIAALGSDLSLYVPNGEVAVAFPINQLSGAAFAMRPGDLVDVLMSLRIVEIDPEFRSILPNLTARVIESRLLGGQQFLFEEIAQGRLEFIPGVNQVAEIIPREEGEGEEFIQELGRQIPQRVTQLTIQQAEVLWVGTWEDPAERARQQEATRAAEVATAQAAGQEPPPAETPDPFARQGIPDVVVLSMSTQDALVLEWARLRGLNIDLALRAPGDNSVFVTTSVTLPQIIDQGALSIPDPSDIDLAPRADVVTPPALTPTPGS